MRNESFRLDTPKADIDAMRKAEGIPVPRGKSPPPKFVYVHYNKSWEWDDKYGFIPRPKKLNAVPGANGVKRDLDLTPFVSMAVGRGATYINPKDDRLGPYKGYVRYYPTNDGRKWYTDAWATATVLGDGTVLWDTDENGEKFKQFQVWLRDHNVVDPMEPEIARMLIGRTKERLNMLRSRSAGNPHLQAQAEELRLRIDRMEAAVKEGGTQLHAAQESDLEDPEDALPDIAPRPKRAPRKTKEEVKAEPKAAPGSFTLNPHVETEGV